MSTPPTETLEELEQNVKLAQERASLAKAQLRAMQSESRTILTALKLQIAEQPHYGDIRLARDFGVEPDRVARIRKRHGLKWGVVRRAGRAEQLPLVLETLRANGGNVKRTARATGVPESTVRRWKERLGRAGD